MHLTKHYVLAGAHGISMIDLEVLSRHEDFYVRRRVADRKRVTPEILEALASDSSPAVRSAVALNPQTSMNLLLDLLVDPSNDVRYCMAENHSLPKSLLEALAQDSNPYVQQRAQTTLSHLNS